MVKFLSKWDHLKLIPNALLVFCWDMSCNWNMVRLSVTVRPWQDEFSSIPNDNLKHGKDAFYSEILHTFSFYTRDTVWLLLTGKSSKNYISVCSWDWRICLRTGDFLYFILRAFPVYTWYIVRLHCNPRVPELYTWRTLNSYLGHGEVAFECKTTWSYYLMHFWSFLETLRGCHSKWDIPKLLLHELWFYNLDLVSFLWKAYLIT